MPIQKRSILPLAIESDKQHDDPRDGRSPDLQGQRYDVWHFIKMNPRCTRDDVTRGLALKSSTATARIKELIDLGYVVEPPGLRKENRSGVKAKVLQLSDRRAGGKPAQKVRVEVTLTIDSNGVYGATARVIGGLRQSGRATPITTRSLTLQAPPTASYGSVLDDSDLAPVSVLETQLNADQIIDAEYKIIES